MKVLFAVNNDDISNAIVKRYQKSYKEIISYKNVYYFNAIIKELQKDSTYDRIVISEELEPFANNNYDTIDKFIFEKLDNISDEAINKSGRDTDIILICSDRRTKSDDILIKLFGIGIYSAIIGNDRSIDEICRLINTPRNKKDAKIYYKIDSGDVMYQAESENSVSEAEVQNILAHYKRLGKNEEKYVESFDNIVSQYTDNQLKIIIRYLPMYVKAVLEVQSPKYRELTAVKVNKNQTSMQNTNIKKTAKQGLNVKMIDKESTKKNISKPIVIPSKMDLNYTKKIIKQEAETQLDDDDFIDIMEDVDTETDFEDIKPITEEKIRTETIKEDEFDLEKALEEDEFDLEKALEEDNEEKSEQTETIEEQQIPEKRGRGRPRKYPVSQENDENKPKRGRGRPRKNVEDVEAKLQKEKTNQQIEKDDELNLFELDEDDAKEDVLDNSGDDLNLFSLDQDEEELKEINAEEDEEAIDLFDLDDEDYKEESEVDNSLFDDNDEDSKIDEDIFDEDEEDFSNNQLRPIGNINNSDKNLISKDRKIVAFVGTTKNGTSFIVNNLAEYLSSIGISTAILDMSKNKNAYYIYTDNQDKLRKIASQCMYKLKTNIAEGIKINKNLSIFTEVPGEEKSNTSNEIDTIINTLSRNFSVVLIDCDFETNSHYFELAQEIYLVQSMDVLTIQPLTAFLKQLKNRNILNPEKLRVVINKEQRMKNLPLELLVGGISKYNSPDMTLMDNLFNKDTIKKCVIPFEMQNYTKYLEALVECKLSLNGYTKNLINALKELGNMVYPLVGQNSYNPGQARYNSNFSTNINSTLNKMKKNYQ